VATSLALEETAWTSGYWMACCVKVDVKRPVIMIKAPNEGRSLSSRQPLLSSLCRLLTLPLEAEQQLGASEPAPRCFLKQLKVDERSTLAREEPHPF